ncbi:MAG: glycosyltransferase [Clostridium tyrobutyricum]|jgi:glycosyltransferase involved in cell wall biosynthesis/phospholipid N-methyltransferase|uniref:glycosyltransferase n=1 Tax=Clostridium tyrobutyricum TaxID=1519 RepID=UPI00242E39A8|nr:glycosyltransferase [Clostridium tyrobutyricum]MCH4259678.1 glycosyltransferase [Clostridium tyrobutyricum]MCI1240111.1 glycosyltransferase [Clostridium tyrobutyricum]MCI1651633.1 glycosyltransferase [Clostridium tyrobutyricum]MCI1938481.1 glycosyltransferase [Clostridium tyrobutyricum]MCI1993821.1 glycosyltransferase [Clostridium tyrobutyricum]
MGNDIDLIKKQLKDNIQQLIDNGSLKEAKSLIEQYKGIAQDDVEAYSMDAVVLIMEEKFDQAEQVLKEGLNIDEDNFDLNYNLGYVYEKAEKFNMALECYEKARKSCNDENLKRNIRNTINAIRDKHPEAINENRLKLIFFVKQGMDSFLGNIIDGLSNEYITKKVIVTDYKQIDKGMEWADICWFEWCDELVIYGSKLFMASEKKIICRLHSYEAFTDYPSKVDWDKVDKLIFVGEHIRKFITNKFKIDNKKIEVIPNGIDVNKWTFKDRKLGYNIAYVGYINYKKGPMLLLHTFKAIYDKNHKYKLYIAGKFQDDRDVLYFKQMIKEFNIENNVIFNGWQDNLDKWLENKNYILCTSILESQNMSVMQAMAKGIKPIIHNFVGAKNVYTKKYIWNTIDDAVHMILQDNYNSKDYRKFIENNYSLNKQIGKIKQVIGNKIIGNKLEKGKFNYKEYWNNRLNNKFDIEGVGYIGLGQIYNEYLYKTRFEILNYIIEEIFENINDKSILELGPGIGMFTNYFCENNVNNYSAIDISEKSQKELSKKYRKFNFILGDISEKKYYPKGEYDLIFAADVLLHLTDEEKYKDVIKNLSDVLSENGYIITFDPVTVINSKSISPHLVIRDINYIKGILKENDLEVIGMIPSAFFMNYPFDKDIIKDKAGMAQNMFNSIQSVFGSSELSSNIKRDLADWVSLLDKQCLINNKFGLSQKALIIKKSINNSVFDFDISNVWDTNDIKSQLIKREDELNKSQEINKYNIVNLFKNNVNSIINLKQNNLEVKPLVTIGITNYNGKQYLKKCIESFLNQTYLNIELLLIDDCSTDGSREIIQEYEKKYKNIRGIYHKVNSGGASKGIQEIIQNSRGKYFQWIACDDFVEKNAVEMFVGYLEENSDKDYVYSDFNIVNEDNLKTGEWNYKYLNYIQVIQYIFYNASGIIPMNCMYKLEFFKKNHINWIIYKNNDFSCDTVNSLQFIKYNWNYGRIGRCLINYRIHSNNLSNNLKKRNETLVTVFDYIIKNFSEEIYFPQVDWNNVQDRMQFKNYLIADFYYKQFLNLMNKKSNYSYLDANAVKEKNKQQQYYLFIKEGMSYIEEGLKMGKKYEVELNQLKSEFYKVYEMN